jgi:hypothetical protein
MAYTAKELLEIMTFAAKLGLTYIDVEGVKMGFEIKTSPVLHPQSQQQVPLPQLPDMKAEDLVTPISVFDELTDEEILFYSCPYGEELQAAKEQRAALIKEEEDKNV